MTRQYSRPHAPNPVDAGQTVAQLRHVLELVERIAARPATGTQPARRSLTERLQDTLSSAAQEHRANAETGGSRGRLALNDLSAGQRRLRMLELRRSL